MLGMLPSAMSHLIRRVRRRPHTASPARPRPGQAQLGLAGQTELVICDKTIEETFRDLKNPRLGLGLKQTVVTRNDRRDALFLLATLAHALLTLLGKAGQELGMERWLGTTRPGGISLFRQGVLLYDLIPNMREEKLRPLLTRFGELLCEHALFTGILGLL